MAFEVCELIDRQTYGSAHRNTSEFGPILRGELTIIMIVSPAKTAESFQMSLGMWTRVGPR